MRVAFILTKDKLTNASQLKLRVTNSNLYDMFIVTAKANGHKMESSKKDTNKVKLPEASFASFEHFLVGG